MFFWANVMKHFPYLAIKFITEDNYENFNNFIFTI